MQKNALANWVESLEAQTCNYLQYYIARGHADHFLGLGILHSRFPGMNVVATKGAVERMRQQIEATFPSQLSEPVMTAKVLRGQPV